MISAEFPLALEYAVIYANIIIQSGQGKGNDMFMNKLRFCTSDIQVIYVKCSGIHCSRSSAHKYTSTMSKDVEGEFVGG